MRFVEKSEKWFFTFTDRQLHVRVKKCTFSVKKKQVPVLVVVVTSICVYIPLIGRLVAGFAPPGHCGQVRYIKYFSTITKVVLTSGVVPLAKC